MPLNAVNGTSSPLPTRIGLGVTNCRPAADVVASVREAEALGAEIAFIAEDINCRDAFSLGCLAAGVTERIRIATGVVNPYTRNPTSLAMGIATLDEVSAGRATLGMGSSSPTLVEGQMGIPMGKQVAVMRESVEIIRALLSGEQVSYAGARFIYANAHLEATPIQPRIPIFFAAMGPLMLRLAGAMSDGVLLNVGASTQYIEWAVNQIHRGAASAGRSPEEITVAAWITAYITEDEEIGLQRAREWLAGMLSIPRQGELLLERGGFSPDILPAIRANVTAYPHAGDRKAAAAHVPPEVARELTIIGTREAAAARLAAYRTVGVDLPVLGPSALRALVD